MAFVKNPGSPIELDGVRYVMPPLSLGVLEQMDDEAMSLLTGNSFTGPRMKLIIDMMFAALKRNYPDIKRTVIAENLDMGNLQANVEALMRTSGLSKDPDSVLLGEASANEQPSGSTSSPSSLATPGGPSNTSESTSTVQS